MGRARLLRCLVLSALLGVGCGEVSEAQLPAVQVGDGELTIFAPDDPARSACIQVRAEQVATAYREGRLIPIRARVNGSHPRFLAVAESERAELRFPDGTRLLVPLGERMAAVVDGQGNHRLLEVPGDLTLNDCP